MTIVNYSFQEGVATIEFNRPNKHNALSAETRDILVEITSQILSLGSELRCVVIRGAGKSFCSGADLNILRNFTTQQAVDFMIQTTWTFRRLEMLPVPILASVSGYCLGGGFELALHCDEIIAADDTTFGFPETSIGLVTTAGSVARLIACVGMMRAKNMLLSGRRVNANEAYQIGLATQVVARDQLETVTQNRVAEILKQPAQALEKMKSLIRSYQQSTFTQSWIAESEAFESILISKKPASEPNKS